ncbi:IPT/TIG domain-containing protein [Ancylobacter sp. FA202]|uniref:IPT/TIG domain-containing protein n=1 Tax=Ancylobacter sp. FA202 TaxID=1111106 RepID=UPI00037BA7F1|nr:IPT/TIG domain-containing protein [Ancylobacter sp. FA202]
MAEAYIGEIRMFCVPPDPSGWLPCDGRALPVANLYLALFSLISTTYGGDGKNSFNLPDLRGRAALGRGIASTTVLGYAGGTEFVTLAADQLPQHTHQLRFADGAGTSPVPTGCLPARATAAPDGDQPLLYDLPQDNSPTTTLDPETVGVTGGGAAHSNLQPSFVIGYFIAIAGAYPPRPGEIEAAPAPAAVIVAPKPAAGGFVGEVRLYAGLHAPVPQGWALCDGTELKVSDYTALFSVIGTIFGGNGYSTFNLPDMRDRTAVGLGNGPGLTPRPTIGATFGETNVQLTYGQMPPHTHAFNVLTSAATMEWPTQGVMYAQAQRFLFYQGPSTQAFRRLAMAPRALSQGDTQSGLHNNMMPSLALYYIVCLNGIYPTPGVAPRVSSVSPPGGPPVPPAGPDAGEEPGGGLQVTISGTDLSIAGAAPSVTFGGTPAHLDSYSASAVVVQCPPGNGTVMVEVTTANGSSQPNAGCQFSYLPSVTGLFPASGSPSGGANVTVKGVGFNSATAVTFGSIAAAGFQVLDGHTLLATTPPQLAAGSSVPVTVTAGGATSAVTPACRYALTSLFISVSPGFGPAAGGNMVTITGTNFDPNLDSFEVWFGTSKATDVTIVSPTEITAVVPRGVGVVEVAVGSAASASTGVVARYSYAAILSDFSPKHGNFAGGTSVTLTGENFDPASTVLFGSVKATPAQVTPTRIVVTAPAGTVTARLNVSGPGGASTDAHELPPFSYLPQLDSLSPSVGTPVDDPAVTLSGSNFTPDATVSFGGVAASLSSISATRILAVPPNGTAGATVDVTVTTGGGRSAARGYTYAQLAVTGLQPAAGPPGTVVTIAGIGFGSSPAVLFGTEAAKQVTVNAAGTEIVCVAPGGIDDVNVSVTAGGNISPTVKASRYSYAPILHAISPDAGMPPAEIVLTGEGFMVLRPYGQPDMVVKFGATQASILTSTTTSATVAVPSGAGRVPVRVGTAGGKSNQVSFTYVPAVLSVSAPYGTEGSVVRIAGAGLGSPLIVKNVRFGSVAAAQAWTEGDETVFAQVPAGTGVVPVIVTTSAGTTAAWSGAMFAYAPVVDAVSPAGGPPAGGTVVTLTGSAFTGATSVTFGGTPGLRLKVVNDGQLTVTTTPGVGEVDVTVHLPKARSGLSEGSTFTFGPEIRALSPASLSIQETGRVVITGEGFQRIRSINFCGIEYDWASQGDLWAPAATDPSRQIYIAVRPPSGGPGTYSVTVTTAYGTSAPASFVWTS